jgi:hypothetical protein
MRPRAMMKQKRPSFARTTITVPRMLKQRMKREGQLINWSAVATAAFRAKLNEMDQQTETRSLDGVVARLKRPDAEKAPCDRALRRGARCGRQWAMIVAEKPQLERLSALRQQHTDEQWKELFSQDAGWRKVARAIDPDVKQPKRTWRRILQDRRDPPNQFYAAFAASALDVWEQVKDRV